jgi:predicted kinase
MTGSKPQGEGKNHMADWRAKRQLTVLMGAPGAGKSTYAARFPNRVSTDALRELNGAMTPEDVDRVYEAAFAHVVTLLRNDKSVVLDTNGAHPATRRRALSIARAYHAVARLVVFTTPLDVCIARQEGRQHPVPADVIEEIAQRIGAQMDDVLEEGWATVDFLVPGVVRKVGR